MPTAPLLALPAIPRERWRLGLRDTAREAPAGTYYGPDTEQGRLLGGGVTYAPLLRGNANLGTFDPCDFADVTFSSNDCGLTFLAWGLLAWEDFPTNYADPMDLRARAVDHLERQTSHLTEQVLSTGVMTSGTLATLAATITPAADNIAFNATTVAKIDGNGAHDLTDAMGYINAYAADNAGGERLWIHMEPRLLPFMGFYGQGFRDGSRSLVQALGDHRIVAGSGYDGSGPSNTVTGTGESWVYLTTPVRFIESPISSPDNVEAFTDRNLNRFRPVATRLVIAEWDLTIHAAIKVCLPEPGPDCGTGGS